MSARSQAAASSSISPAHRRRSRRPGAGTRPRAAPTGSPPRRPAAPPASPPRRPARWSPADCRRVAAVQALQRVGGQRHPRPPLRQLRRRLAIEPLQRQRRQARRTPDRDCAPPTTSATGSAISRRAANPIAAAEARSTHCASSTSTTTGRSSAWAAISASVAAPTANRSSLPPPSMASARRHRPRLRRRDTVERRQRRAQQLEQAGERDVGLRLDAAHAQHRHLLGALGRVVEQPRLADARPRRPVRGRRSSPCGRWPAARRASEAWCRGRSASGPAGLPSLGGGPGASAAAAAVASVATPSPTGKAPPWRSVRQQRPIDEDKLNAFVFKAVEELGATLNAALVVMGDRLGLYKQMAADGPVTAVRPGRPHVDGRAVRPRVAERPGGRRLRRVRPRHPHATRCCPSRRWRWPTSRARRSCPAPSRSPPAWCATPRRSRPRPAAVPASAGTSTTTTCSTAASGSSGPGYNANLVSTWLPALEGVVAKLETGATVADIGCGHGASTILMARVVPAPRPSPASTTTTSRSRPPASGPPRPASATACSFQTAPASAYPRRAVRPGHDVRLPARHGRPGRRRPPRVPLARPGRHLDGRRAARRRPRGGQPEPGRTRVLRVLDPPLHARLAVPGGRPRARHAGRRGAHPRRRHGGRLHAVPPRRPRRR